MFAPVKRLTHGLASAIIGYNNYSGTVSDDAKSRSAFTGGRRGEWLGIEVEINWSIFCQCDDGESFVALGTSPSKMLKESERDLNQS
jgi:hypothetical protein